MSGDLVQLLVDLIRSGRPLIPCRCRSVPLFAVQFLNELAHLGHAVDGHRFGVFQSLNHNILAALGLFHFGGQVRIQAFRIFGELFGELIIAFGHRFFGRIQFFFGLKLSVRPDLCFLQALAPQFPDFVFGGQFGVFDFFFPGNHLFGIIRGLFFSLFIGGFGLFLELVKLPGRGLDGFCRFFHIPGRTEGGLSDPGEILLDLFKTRIHDLQLFLRFQRFVGRGAEYGFFGSLFLKLVFQGHIICPGSGKLLAEFAQVLLRKLCQVSGKLHILELLIFAHHPARAPGQPVLGLFGLFSRLAPLKDHLDQLCDFYHAPGRARGKPGLHGHAREGGLSCDSDNGRFQIDHPLQDSRPCHDRKSRIQRFYNQDKL